MSKSIRRLGVSLILAGISTLPALAGEANVRKFEKMDGPPVFSDIDTNKDGVISQVEFDAFRPKEPDGRHNGRRGPMPFRGPDMSRLDTDKDGRISLEEFIAPMKSRFARMDANKDGFLDEAELKAPPSPPE